MASIQKTKYGFRVFVRRRNISDSKTFYNYSEAAAWGAAREHEILSESSANPLDRRNTLHKAFDRFSDEEATKRKGARWEKARLARFKREFDDVPMAKLGKTHIIEWRNKRLAEVKGSSVRRDMNLLRSVLETARKEWGWISSNPMDDVGRPADSVARKYLLKQSDIDEVVKALCFEDGKPVLLVKQKIAVAFLIALETGMRAGELVRADVHGKVARLNDTKNGDYRDVPLSKRARELFAMVGNRLDINLNSMDAMFRLARDSARLSEFTFHDSRHYACTMLAKKLQPMDLAKMLGHRSLKQTLQYYNPDPDDLADLLG